MKKTIEKPLKKLPDVKENKPDKPDMPEEGDHKGKGTPPPLFVSSGDEELDKAFIETLNAVNKHFKKK